MAPAVNDTIVVCRPEQVREAAVVLSCCPADRFTPLIVVEPSPISEDEYRRLYDGYVEARDRRDAVTGGPLARSTAIHSPGAVAALRKEVDDAAEALTPYRSWWRHQRLVSDLLRRLPLRRAVFLFATHAQENRLINALPMRRIGDQREPTIPETIEWLSILPLGSAGDGTSGETRHMYASLCELTEVAWRALGHSEDIPKDAIEVPQADESAYFNGLWRALARGVPLRPTNASRTDSNTDYAAEAKEAVLVELSREADKLLGAQYAHQRRAKLIVYAEPDCDAQRRLRTVISARQDEREGERTQQGAQGATQAAPDKFLGALGEYLFGDPTVSQGIRRIEDAVSAMVPEHVVNAVGELDLTAFTSGIPYNFVKKNGADWSSKAIGHIAGDAALLVLTEMCRVPKNTGVGFSLLFDPGYFEAETQAVLGVLQKQSSYPLVLQREAGSSLALLQLGPSMPLDVLFFNTHGSDQAIVLSDGPLPAFKLLQRQTLASRPFIFNSSCLSWVGVGREFVRVGARGYVGTLWSVDADIAREYARRVLDRVTQGEPVSRALRKTGVAVSTERAYIYIGTCGARLQGAALIGPDEARRRVAKAAEILFDEIMRLLEQTDGASDLPFFPALENLLWTEAKKLVAEYDRRWAEPNLERLELAILELQVISRRVDRRRDEAAEALLRIADAERMLDALALEPDARCEPEARLTQFAGRINLRLGRSQQAVAILLRSVKAAEAAHESIAPQSLDLCDALRALGRNPEALEWVKKADASFAAENPSSRERLYSLGRLAQLSSALRDYDAALRYARQGFTLAGQLDDLKERSDFKGDEARALLRIPRLDEALAAAHEYLDLARHTYEERRELAAFGVIGQTLIAKGDFAHALEYVQKGLDYARRSGVATSIGDFLMDMAAIEMAKGNHERALDCNLEAAAIFGNLGQMPKVRVALGQATDHYRAIFGADLGRNTWDILLRLLKVEISVLGQVDPPLRHSITIEVVRRLQALIARVGVAPIRDGIHMIAQEAQAIANSPQTAASDQLKFVVEALGLFDDLGQSRFAEARQRAQNLDALSQAAFQLVSFVDQKAFA